MPSWCDVTCKRAIRCTRLTLGEGRPRVGGPAWRRLSSCRPRCQCQWPRSCRSPGTLRPAGGRAGPA
eukprot:607442-Rhodomonas_salina.1